MLTAYFLELEPGHYQYVPTTIDTYAGHTDNAVFRVTDVGAPELNEERWFHDAVLTRPFLFLVFPTRV